MQHRQCVLLEGELAWHQRAVAELLHPFDSDRVLCCTTQLELAFPSLPIKQVKHRLGHEYDAVVVDGLLGIDPDSLGIVMGTIRAGGVLVLCLPERSDQDSLWHRRFRCTAAAFVSSSEYFHHILVDDVLPDIAPPLSTHNGLDVEMTGDQKMALAAIMKVVHGHRRRPLVISADRGRGKSAVLGMAAAQLVLAGKQRIVVTAPSLAISDMVFKHAALLLSESEVSKGLIESEQFEIRFVAPDVLCESAVTADLVLVDEAAAIPNPLLEQILKRYSRLVFSTTLHGYEGTGRGFEVRFQTVLDQMAPGWQQCELKRAIRWRDDDVLETFSFEALLLDAAPTESASLLEASTENVTLSVIEQTELVEQETDLRALFGLMVLAHYRTRPSDLKMLLDQSGVRLYVLRYKDMIIGSAWLVDEGLLSSELAMAVYQGQRRLKGHLLPQSLLSHMGIATAGDYRYRRILRIAIHPSLQNRGLASAVIKRIVDDCQQDQIDVLGASFGVDEHLSHFWRTNGFLPVRLGLQRDEVTGHQALIVLQACSSQGEAIVDVAKDVFDVQWLDLVTIRFDQLATELVVALAQQIASEPLVLSDWQQQELMRFCQGETDMHTAQWVIVQFVRNRVRAPVFLALHPDQQTLLVKWCIQQQSPGEIAGCLGLAGQAAVQQLLRTAVMNLLLESDLKTARV